MRKKLLALLALVAALAISPNLHADTFTFKFTDIGGVSGSGSLEGTKIAPRTWLIDSATGTFNDGTNSGAISLVTNPNAPGSTAVAGFAYDDLLHPLDGPNQYLDTDGLLFNFAGMYLNLWQLGGGPGTDSWNESNGAGDSFPPTGTFALTSNPAAVPEPGTLLLAATGLLGLAAIRFATAK